MSECGQGEQSQPLSSGGKTENKGWRQGWGETGRAGQGDHRPQFRIGRTWTLKSDKTVIQTRFMCSAAECGRVEAGDREAFQPSDP